MREWYARLILELAGIIQIPECRYGVYIVPLMELGQLLIRHSDRMSGLTCEDCMIDGICHCCNPDTPGEAV